MNYLETSTTNGHDEDKQNKNTTVKTEYEQHGPPSNRK